jgi:hypothetical protein
MLANHFKWSGATMPHRLHSQRYDVEDYTAAIDLINSRDWGDGLPVIPPTEDLVAEFIDVSAVPADTIVGEMPERASSVSVEKLAINAVMAGCVPDSMPVLIAIMQAVSDEAFHFNHLASLGAPWPIIIVNGPVATKLGLNSGLYLFGPGNKANATIARAVSLTLANCAGAKSAGIQRGQWGNPIRWFGCVAENENTAWTPLHVQKGFDRTDSTVTIVSVYPSTPYHVTTVLPKPTRMLDAVCHAMSNFGGAQWTRGMYTVFVGPHHAEAFADAGWSKEAVRNYIYENTKSSVADLKYRGFWGAPHDDLSEDFQHIEAGDSERFVYLFKDNGEDEGNLFIPSQTAGREVDIQLVVAGGNAGRRIAIAVPYQMSANPVTKLVRP